ncbi:MAG: DedA family protein [Bacteroidetes bacterium]|nr:DedA family protein [Bacteroidota bacterium]
MSDIHGIITTYGGLGLLVISFIAATLVPLSSEVALYAALRAGLPPIEALFWASAGNCLGVSFNYWLGRKSGETVLGRAMASRGGRRAVAWTERYGKWSLLLSWLPVVGDPLTLVAGVMRVQLAFFIVTAFSVRIARYALLVAFY